MAPPGDGVGVVWLLAAAIHRDDSADDAYEHCARLQTARQLLPTAADIQRELDRRAHSWASTLLEELPRLRAAALENPGAVQSGVLGGRVGVRLLHEGGDPPILSVDVSQRLVPGELTVPPAWQVQLFAALFPTASFNDVCYVSELGAGQPLHDDELGFCEFADA